ncbi:PfkB family carbohydrate kinase [Solicola sp. PLA-1-18]|uniref:PfkB family carbohydrate kinase n=1 Tax=Solicola sp. PLA-1-18 TaxID=3380532 RepID=UPI003B7D667C
MTPRLVHTGPVVVDLVLHVPAVPEPGSDLVASAASVVAGGGLNVLVAAQRDGLAVRWAGRRGTGTFGTVVADALREHGVEEVQLPVLDRDSGWCVALVDADAERTFVTVGGAEEEMGPDELARIDARAGDVVYVTGYSLVRPGTGPALAAWAAALPPDVTLLLDPGPLVAGIDADTWSLARGRCDLLSLNAREATALSGLDDPGPAALRLAELMHDGAHVVVRDGADGCWVALAGAVEPHHVPGVAVTAVDTSGAGDTHCGVLAAGLAREDDVLAAARRANVAAALSVTRPGPATAPTSAETDARLAREVAG